MLVPFDLVAWSGAESSGDRSALQTPMATPPREVGMSGQNGEQPAGEDTADSDPDTSTEHPRCHNQLKPSGQQSGFGPAT